MHCGPAGYTAAWDARIQGGDREEIIRLGQAKVEEIHPGLPHGWQKPKHLAHLLLHSQATSMEPDQE